MCDDLTCQGIEKHFAVAVQREIEHVVNRPGDYVERPVANSRKPPVILDEADDGTLIGKRIVHEVLLRKRGNDQERQPRAVSTSRLKAGQCSDTAAAIAGPGGG